MELSTLIDRANLLIGQGRYKDAEKQIKQVLDLEPENGDALSVLARCYFNSDQIDKGIEIVQEAIRIDPEEAFYFYLLGFGYYRKNNYEAAISNLNKAIELNPYGAEYFGLLSFVYLEEKELQTALAKANEGLRLDPENLTCLNARSMALNKMSKTDEAIETMQDALSKDPDNEFTHSTIGWNFLEKGRHNDAAKHFREALRISPNHSGSKSGLKEALKSKIPPYKWLLQFNFWLGNKGKTFRWVFVIAIFLGVRIISTISKENPEFENIGLFIAGAYFLFVATSWIINPLANLFLLFHKEGKYALNKAEKWNAVAFLICVLCGVALMSLSSLPADEKASGNYIAAGLVVLTLCVPAGHMTFPIRFRNNSTPQWISIALLGLGLVSVCAVLAGFSSPETLFILYFILFVIYTWTNSF